MEKAVILLTLKLCLVASKEAYSSNESKNNDDLQSSNSGKILYDYLPPVIQLSGVQSVDQQVQNFGYIPPNLPLIPQPLPAKIDLHSIAEGNPLIAALLLGASLGLSSKTAAPNHPELLPINPYIALLLSQYGRYVPFHGTARGLYGYAAANNFHNNKPFGAYKVHEDFR